jgi:hypothetical protein
MHKASFAWSRTEGTAGTVLTDMTIISNNTFSYKTNSYFTEIEF